MPILILILILLLGRRVCALPFDATVTAIQQLSFCNSHRGFLSREFLKLSISPAF